MNLRDLKYLVLLAEHKHFGKAAKAAFISQPTLSSQVKKLEDELGVALFERTNKQVLLTPIGKALIAQSHVILQEAEKLKELAKQAKDPLSGEFKLGLIPTLAPYLLPHIIPTLQKQLPKLELVLHEDKTDHLLAQLRQGKLDAIILALPVDTYGFSVKELFREKFLLALPKNHSFANKKNVKTSDLNGESLLLLDDGHCLREQALDVCRQSGVKQKCGLHATSLETLRHMVAAGNGITLLPALAINKNSALVIKEFAKPQPYRNIGMLWRKQSSKILCCETLAQLIIETVKKIM